MYIWQKLNATFLKKGVTNPNFKRFMTISAQANWNANCIISESGNPTMKMIDKEQTCLFHCIQSFNKHTKQFIALEFQDRHKALCYEYNNARSLEEVDLRYVAIYSWWYSSRIVGKGAIQEFNNQLNFWHFHVRQSGGFMLDVIFFYITLSIDENALCCYFIPFPQFDCKFFIMLLFHCIIQMQKFSLEEEVDMSSYNPQCLALTIQEKRCLPICCHFI